mmetsp:Transcript_5303/g.19232  ORF Transcript_5303/g.19232 Transcript_5303/m.19232 type:complete len:178 (+) Transcript_5303:455-988(+)
MSRIGYSRGRLQKDAVEFDVHNLETKLKYHYPDARHQSTAEPRSTPPPTAPAAAAYPKHARRAAGIVGRVPQQRRTVATTAEHDAVTSRRRGERSGSSCRTESRSLSRETVRWSAGRACFEPRRRRAPRAVVILVVAVAAEVTAARVEIPAAQASLRAAAAHRRAAARRPEAPAGGW